LNDWNGWKQIFTKIDEIVMLHPRDKINKLKTDASPACPNPSLGFFI
jgi:hypothetical protein